MEWNVTQICFMRFTQCLLYSDTMFLCMHVVKWIWQGWLSLVKATLEFQLKEPWECDSWRFSEFTGTLPSSRPVAGLSQLGCRILLHSLEKPQVCLWCPYLQTVKKQTCTHTHTHTDTSGHHGRVEAAFKDTHSHVIGSIFRLLPSWLIVPLCCIKLNE